MTRSDQTPANVCPVCEIWSVPPYPNQDVLTGNYCQLDRLDAEKHAALLFRVFEGHDQVWDYLPYGPFLSQYHRWVREVGGLTDTVFSAIKNLCTGAVEVLASFLRISPEVGSIEVGHINMSPRRQRTPAATEAMYRMMQWASEVGCRRYEWKCNAANIPSCRAAQRLGLSYEGVFRQAAIVKGRNRDTTWFASIDSEWPAPKEAFKAWLDPCKFDANGRKNERLSDLTRLVRHNSDQAL